ncbi:helix-turn-helix domain-containing protein [Gloeobacter morelensis]|uniref:helix-turn-helix domain-containing protein n=1 Tax=Gloeobacter morelensis TaxID=2907343 RepID=UPI001E509020|nr:helix-turn-helix transcriptional regulator [Gloeobacter morelensis]UFP97203.1 helix-turn-helix domain-containing protein [Gloeobacter morelensis MG652769]
MNRASEPPEKLEGVWTPRQLAELLGVSRQTVIDAINGKGAYPRPLRAQKAGQLWLVADRDAQVYLHWARTGELLPQPDAPPKLYWTTGELAAAAGVSTKTVSHAVTGWRSGKYGYPPTLPAVKFGKIWLVKDPHAREFIQDRARGGGQKGDG